MTNFFDELLKGDYDDFLVEVVLERSGVTVYDKYRKEDNPDQEGHKDECCQICWDSLIHRYAFQMVCGHVYHRKCLLKIIMQNQTAECEICRAQDMVRGFTGPAAAA